MKKMSNSDPCIKIEPLKYNIPKIKNVDTQKDHDKNTTKNNHVFYEQMFYGYTNDSNTVRYDTYSSNKRKRKSSDADNINSSSSDGTLPKKLRKMFEHMQCFLCDVKFTSTTDGMIHYKSKRHNNNIQSWLLKFASDTQQPVNITHKNDKKEKDKDPKYFYCEICDLPLTGRLHAESHYMGKAHLKVFNGSTPNHKTQQSTFCDICQVNLLSQPQYEAHIKGLKHLKKVKNLNPISDQKDSCLDAEEILRCDLCLISVNSKQQLTEHLSSKKHLKKMRS